MTDETLAEGPTYRMGEEESLLAQTVYQAITDQSRYSLRSEQSANFKAGISDLGYCSERTRRMLANEVPEDVDTLKMFIGTWLGEGMEQACKDLWPNAIIQQEVVLQLTGEMAVYNVLGHPDLILPDEGILVDFKSSRGLQVPRRTGPSQSQQFQRHCYAKAAWQQGWFPKGMSLDEVQVANVWIDRGGDDQELFCQMEPYSEEIVTQATFWLDEVVYAFAHPEQGSARKEPAYEVCRTTCGFFSTCRAGEVHAQGLLTDPAVLAATAMYREGLELEKQGRRLKDEAKAGLVGVSGSTGEWAVSWTWVNGTEVNYIRDGYNRLNIRKVK